MTIFHLNQYCQLEIIKYIVADCEMRDKSQDNKMKYADIVNFSLAHENFEAILEEYYPDFYKSLEFLFVAKRYTLEIEFSELETTHRGKGGDAFWRLYANAIRQNAIVHEVALRYFPKSMQPNFLYRFEQIKRALENKKNLRFVTIKLNGYSLEDLNNFGYITKLDLEVRMSAEALVEVCKSNPHLETLYFGSTEILGRLSGIAPHCRNLRALRFEAKPDIDGVEYAPLAELANLEKMAIRGAFENGSQLTIFEAITKRKRPGLIPLEIIFYDDFPLLRNDNVNIARANSILELIIHQDLDGIQLCVSYDFWDISRDNSPSEHSLATIPLIKANLKINYNGLTLYKCPTSDTDISGFISILKLFKIQTLKINIENGEIPIAKLVASIISDNPYPYALKSIDTADTNIDQFVTSELVKIKSITSLNCQLRDWESVELLSELTNLETVFVDVEKEFEMNYSQALCRLINTCSTRGFISGFDWCIEFIKIERFKIQSKSIIALKMSRSDEGEAKSHFFEAFRSHRDLITIEELDVLKWVDINIKDIVKMAEMHPIKKLRISLANTNDIEQLSDLAELEELTIHDSVKGSLIKLFDQMAMKSSPSLQCLKINSKHLSSEELVRVSKIRSLKNLDLCDSELEDCSSLMELTNSNIEELILATPEFSVETLFSAFAKTRIQHLKIKEIPNRYLEISELEELFKIKSLKSLQCTCLHNDASFLRNFNRLEKLDIALFENNLEGLQYLAELEKLESLTLRLHKYYFLKNYDILADIQNLKELKLLVGTDDNYKDVNDVAVIPKNVYQAFVSKNVKLTHLTTTIGCVEELNEITQIKTLRKLHLIIRSIDTKITCLGELSKLESLQITHKEVIMDSDDDDTTDSDDDDTTDSDDDDTTDSDEDYMIESNDKIMEPSNYVIYCVLPILKCCRNLDRLLINSKSLNFYLILREMHTHLKSIRDPTLQGPLTVILTRVKDDKEFWEEYNIPAILVILLENVYMKVYISPKP